MRNLNIIYDDLYRYTGKRSFWLLLRYFFLRRALDTFSYLENLQWQIQFYQKYFGKYSLDVVCCPQVFKFQK
jgi:hypothetical protein